MWKRNYQYFINEIYAFMHVCMSVEHSLKWNKEFINLSLTKDSRSASVVWSCECECWVIFQLTGLNY